jgi:hypothetical protein
VTRGIGDSDAAAGVQGLPNVDPVYTWVRLAQRVPVRIAIDSVPPGIPLVSGMTATVTIKDAAGSDGRTWLRRAIEDVETRLSDVLNSSPARTGCIPARTTGRTTTESLPVPQGEGGSHTGTAQSRSGTEHRRCAKGLLTRSDEKPSGMRRDAEF